MGEYVLKTRGGEIINTIRSESFADAVDIFAQTKKITAIQLLKIFSVKKVS